MRNKSFGKTKFFFSLQYKNIWLRKIIFKILLGEYHIIDLLTSKFVMQKCNPGLIQNNVLYLSTAQSIAGNVY